MTSDSLKDAALIIRGGLMELPGLHDSLELCSRERGYYGLSFFAENDVSIEELAGLIGPARLPQGRVRASTVGAIRALGLGPFRSGAHPHVTVKWDIRPTDEELRVLVAQFGPPQPNPLLEG